MLTVQVVEVRTTAKSRASAAARLRAVQVQPASLDIVLQTRPQHRLPRLSPRRVLSSPELSWGSCLKMSLLAHES